MKRARATALVLVNWKGVFFERYALDRHVTALEGANGAGKTTVMIGAYVVLMPDMTRLRFSNIGESAGSGGDKGIWGRLGEAGRPSYALLEFEVQGEQVLAGIQLERAAEPTVTLTAFTVSGLTSPSALQDVLLLAKGDDEEVPELADLTASVARAGGSVSVYASTKEYFAALFGLGITPLRLSTDEDRNKLNEMLRTSMMGGISRALTSELRSFLLKEESGLGDTLARMRANLAACHRTRTEVGEARHLETEISGVHDAAQAMCAAAVCAARAGADEAHGRVAAARREERDAAHVVAALAEAALQAEQSGRRAQAAIAEALAQVEAAARARERVSRAQGLSERLRELATELEGAAARERRERATRDAVAAARDGKRRSAEMARRDYERAARGLGDLQAGLDELHARAHVARRARHALLCTRTLLGDETFTGEAGACEVCLQEARQRLHTCDAARGRLLRDGASVDAQRDEYARAVSLVRALGSAASDVDWHAEARRILARFAEQENLVARLPELVRERDAAGQLSERQRRARAREIELRVVMSHASSSAAVEDALVAEERALALAEGGARDADGAAAQARAASSAAHLDITAMRGRAPEWAHARALLDRLQNAAQRLIKDRGELVMLYGELLRERQDLGAGTARERADAEKLRSEIRAALHTGGSHSDSLERVRDSVDGEWLATHFDDLPLERAARVEAELGPLAHGILVDDPVSAAQSLPALPVDVSTVWLVGREHLASLGATLTEPTPESELVAVPSPWGVRVSRLPATPVLGRRARERHVEALRAQAEELETRIAKSSARLQVLDMAVSDADALLADASVVTGDDPGLLIAARAQDAERADHAEREMLQRALALRAEGERSRYRVAALRGLLGEAFLLDLPDQAERAAALDAQILEACAARDELRRSALDRRLLLELHETLRVPPESHEQAAARMGEIARLAADREHGQRLCEALEELAAVQHGLGWPEAEEALRSREVLAPELEAQHRATRAALEACDAAVLQADEAWQAATLALQHAEAARAAVEAHHARLAAELGAEGLMEADAQAVLVAEQAHAAADATRRQLEAEERRVATDALLIGERCRTAQARRAEAETALDRAIEIAEPAERTWQEVVNLLGRVVALPIEAATRMAQAASQRTSAAFWPDARSKGALLVDRLEAARGGHDAAASVRAALAEAADSPEPYLHAWASVRDWLARRLPVQVASVDDPLLALDRLRAHLGVLEERLTRQEGDLIGASEDVARGVEVHVRRAKAQVRRLNQNLDGVSFGSIGGIRVQMRRVERMDQVLRALRDGAAQELLFQSNLPIEQALDEIFRRYGGGRAGGQRILDYREYIELGVEVRRMSKQEWEVGSPTRLSTGEAIGVGAALMMVILTEWERDANLLRPPRASGSLRFLFLDEANRLSQDNLGVLFELCRTLDLQLLIAAPEVAHADHNTTYRLVRRVHENGREEVIVSGRRKALAEDAPAP